MNNWGKSVLLSIAVLLFSASGLLLSTVSPAEAVIRGTTDFQGVTINYEFSGPAVSGVSWDVHLDHDDGSQHRRSYSGEVHPGTITLSGTVLVQALEWIDWGGMWMDAGYRFGPGTRDTAKLWDTRYDDDGKAVDPIILTPGVPQEFYFTGTIPENATSFSFRIHGSATGKRFAGGTGRPVRGTRISQHFISVVEAPAPPAKTVFSDLSPDHWAHDDIMYMVERGILSGYPDGTFKPNNTISRAEFAKIMVLALELETIRPVTPTFTDVGTDHWAYEVVESARNYLTGYLNTRTGEYSFDPGGKAVREDVAVAIVKAKGYGDTPANLSLLNQFPDQGEISPELRNHVAIAVELGYMRGTDRGFEPQKALTRAEACTLLSRIMQDNKVIKTTF